MHGPIDYIIVGFPGNKFKGEILSELAVAVESGVIAILDISLVTKDHDGNVTAIDLDDEGNASITTLLRDNTAGSLIDADDIAEVGDLLNEDSSAGLLIVEQLWAKGLKQAIISADGVLLAEGRIHPDADADINMEGDK